MLKYITNYIKGAPVYIAISFEAGGMHQNTSDLGVSHLSEHLIATSDADYGLIPAQTDYNFVTFFLNQAFIDHEAMESKLDKLCGIISNRAFDVDAIRRESAVIKNELSNFQVDYPNTNKVILHDYLFTGIKPKKNYEIISGDFGAESTLYLEKVGKFLDLSMKQPVQIVASGDFDIERVKTVLNKHFTYIPEEDKIENKILPMRALTANAEIIKDPIKSLSLEQSYYGIGWSIDGLTEKNRVIAILAMKILSDTKGYIYNKLRNGDCLVYDMSSDATYARNRLNVSLHISFFDLNSGIRLFKDAMLDFIESGAAIEEIKAALELEKRMLPMMSDGARETFSNQLYFSRLGTTIEGYVKFLGDIASSEVFDFFVNNLSFDNSVEIHS